MTADQKAIVRKAARERMKRSYDTKKADQMIRQGLEQFKAKHAGKSKALLRESVRRGLQWAINISMLTTRA